MATPPLTPAGRLENLLDNLPTDAPPIEALLLMLGTDVAYFVEQLVEARIAATRPSYDGTARQAFYAISLGYIVADYIGASVRRSEWAESLGRAVTDGRLDVLDDIPARYPFTTSLEDAIRAWRRRTPMCEVEASKNDE